jgi:hypothetical protein
MSSISKKLWINIKPYYKACWLGIKTTARIFQERFMSVLSGWSAQKKWNVLFGLWALHGMIALLQFTAASHSSFDFSFQQVVISGGLLLWIALNLFLIFSISRKSLWLIKILDLLKNSTVKDGVFTVAALALFLQICLAFLQSVAQRTADFRFVGYIDRLSPLLNLSALILVEVIALNLFFVFREQAGYKKLFKVLAVRIAVVLALLGMTALYISATGMGIAPIYKGDWARGLPAVPLLEWQIILACIVCFGMLVFESNEKTLKIPRLDLWIALAVWLAAVAIWLGQPIVPNSSALEPRAPNFEIYPFSDAQTYDQFSQSVLIGDGFGKNEIPQRPLYIVFLTFLHVLVGQDYGNMIVLQSLVFALFPVLLYIFGREFFGRPIGISIALLAILRDYTSNLVSPFTGNLSYSKLYLAEIPTAMLLILFLWIGTRWIKSGFPAFSGFLMGGVLGIAMLIRTQVVVAFPVLLLFAILVQPKKIMPIIKGALLASLTMILVISPWFWRNWKMTGELIFDNPSSQMANLALRYNRLNRVDANIMALPGESNSAYNARLTQLAAQAIKLNPMGIAKGIVNSFLNHGIDNILVFPLRNSLTYFGELWTPTDPFWQKWEGHPTFAQSALLVFYVFLFGLGLSVAWHRNGWLGFLPLGVNLVYNLWTSLALLSGQRFLLTMDWSIYLYYMIGLFALLSVFLFTLKSGRAMILKWYEANQVSFVQQADSKKWTQYILAGILFFGVGVSLPLSEMAFREKYPPISQAEMSNKLSSSTALKQSKLVSMCFQKIVEENQLRAVQGRAIYPLYYEAGDGETFTDSAGYKAVDEGRLVFEMIGQSGGRIIFPMPAPPDFFPNASDVTLFSDASGNKWFILVEQGNVQKLYFSEKLVSSICN